MTLTVNGRLVQVPPGMEGRRLLDFLREDLDLTGAKNGCGVGMCGACTVLVDGKVMYACSMLAVDAVGRKITTIESLAANHPVVTAFVANDAQQCGYCTPGFVMAATGFLQKNPAPTVEQVSAGLGGNLCRCGTYMGIRKAVVEASKTMRTGGGKGNA